ncbi:hypothetical protein Tco_1138191, partial [Tanacetum coccineum]
MTTIAQKIALGNALVVPKNQRGIGKCNRRINPGIKPKEPTYQVVLDALALTTCYHAFLIAANVPVIYMHQEILNICPKIPSQVFDEPPSEEETISFIKELGHSREIKYITDIDNKDSKKQDKMFDPRFTKAIIHHFLTNDNSISMRNRTFMHTARDDSLVGNMRFISRHEDTQVYGSLLPKAMTNQAMLDSDSYKTYYAISTGAEPLKLKRTQKKFDSTISSEESPSKKKPAKAKKDVCSTKKPATKPKPTMKKAPVKADRGKGLNVLSKVALSEAVQLKKESWGDSGKEENDDEDDTEDESDDNDGNDDDGDNDDNDDDKEEEEYADERVHTPENHELTDEEDNAKEENEEEKDDVVELYIDVNVNLRKEDVEEDSHVTLIDIHDTQKTKGPMQSSSVSSDFTDKLLNFENTSPANNEISFLLDTIVRHEEPSSQTSSLFTVPVMVIPEITSAFTTTIPLPPPSFNPLPQQATPTPTPTTSEVTTSFPALPDFSSVFKLNDRVTNLEKDLLEMKKVDR